MKLEYGDLVTWFTITMPDVPSYIGTINFRTKREAKFVLNRLKKEMAIEPSTSVPILIEHSGLVEKVINYSPKSGDKLVNILCFTGRCNIVVLSKYLTKW